MANIISIINQKGGTGKTTTTINLGRGLAEYGYRVLLIDLDPQSNLTYALALTDFTYTVSNLLLNEIGLNEVIHNQDHVDVIPANQQLSFFFGSNSLPETSLMEKLEDTKDYDFILIDCPPSLSTLTRNALNASTHVLIPMQLDVFSIVGLVQILETIENVNLKRDVSLEILGVLPVMVDVRKKLTTEVLEHVKSEIKVRVLNAFIHTNVKAAESPSFAQSVIDYAPHSKSAKDYLLAASEILKILKRNNQLIKL